MRKIYCYLSFAALIAAFIFSSCDTQEEEEIVIDPEAIEMSALGFSHQDNVFMIELVNGSLSYSDRNFHGNGLWVTLMLTSDKNFPKGEFPFNRNEAFDGALGYAIAFFTLPNDNNRYGSLIYEFSDGKAVGCYGFDDKGSVKVYGSQENATVVVDASLLDLSTANSFQQSYFYKGKMIFE